MKKTLSAMIIGTLTLVAGIFISGYGFIFKAILKNLKKGSLTPSTDDVDQFPYHMVNNQFSEPWKIDKAFNTVEISAHLKQELTKTRASSLLVIKDSAIIYEKYWKDHSESSLINSFSMAKAILAILTGCAIDDGFIESEDQLISTVFPKYENSRYGKYLTFKHLMTMQAGLDWEEEYRHPFAENSKQYFIEDLSEQALNVDFKELPGYCYEYQSVAAQILGLALKKAIGRPLAQYLSEKIWKPLGMEYPAKWSVDEKGMEKAFCCIHAAPRDFAKIGQLILQEGIWKNRQLISSQYCKKLLTPTKANTAFCYSVWADDDHQLKYRFFYGFLGQFIIMIPEKNMVIVKTGFYNRLDVDSKLRPLQVKLLAEECSNMLTE